MICEKCGSSDIVLLFTSYACNVCDKKNQIDCSINKQTIKHSNGNKELSVNGELQENEIKCKFDSNGTKFWYKNRKYHRDNGPAIERTDGTKEWWLNNKRHREDGPAIEHSDNSKFWYKNGELHRDNGPAIEFATGDKNWYINGKRHREDGPAIEHSDCSKEWWINGEFIKKEKL